MFFATFVTVVDKFGLAFVVIVDYYFVGGKVEVVEFLCLDHFQFQIEIFLCQLVEFNDFFCNRT